MNRYSQLSFSDFGQKVLPQLPFDQLDQVLGQFQQQKDITDTLAAQEIDFLQADPDAQFKAKVDTEIQGMKDRLVESAASGDVGNYMTDLRETQRELLKMRSPGGKIKALADRKQQYMDIVKSTTERLQKSGASKEYIDAVISEIIIPEVESPYGGYTSIGDPNVGDYEDLGKIVSDQLKNMKESGREWIVNDGRYINKYGQTEVSTEEVTRAAMEILNQPRFRDQLNREARIKAQREGIDVNEAKRQIAMSYAYPTIKREDFTKTTRDQKGDPFAVKKEAIDYEYQLGSGTLMSDLYTNNTGLPELEYKLDRNGNYDPVEITKHQGGRTIKLEDPDKGLPFKQKFKKDLNEIRKTNPALYDVYNRFRDDFENMSDKQAYNLIKTKYDEKKSTLSKEWVQVQTPGYKMQKVLQRNIVGENGMLGDIRLKTVTVTQAGKAPETMTIGQFLKKEKISPEDFTNYARYQGDIKSMNSLQPTGNIITFVSENKEKDFQLIVSDTSIEEARIKSPIQALYDPAIKGDRKRSATVRLVTGNPALDNEEFFTKAVDKYASDDLQAEYISLSRQLSTLDDSDYRLQEIGKRRMEVKEELDRLQNNPLLDTYLGRDLKLYNTRNPNDPLDMTVEELDNQANQLINKMKDQ